MSRQDGLYQWQQMITSQMPHLSKPQAAVLALWSYGMIWAHSCAQSAVVTFLAGFLKQKPNTVRQRLREWCYEAEAKKGRQRLAIDPQSCFVPLLRWVLDWWHGQQIALALDATCLSDRFVVLALSVLYRGCAIPVAWTILRGEEKHAWQDEWLSLLALLKRAVPAHMTVIVLADRGLYARWLFQAIDRQGWHPLLRINSGGKFRPEGCGCFRPLAGFAPEPGTRWRGRGTAFATPHSRLQCTLLACWENNTEEPWLILTNLPPEASDACWYGMRAWIEQGFKMTKRGGWQWQRTRMTTPERASRLWLAVSVATLWLLSQGTETDDAIPEGTLPDLGEIDLGRRKRRATRLRLVSVFRQGWVNILMLLLDHAPLPPGRFMPESWPEIPQLLPGIPAGLAIEAHDGNLPL